MQISLVGGACGTWLSLFTVLYFFKVCMWVCVAFRRWINILNQETCNQQNKLQARFSMFIMKIYKSDVVSYTFDPSTQNPGVGGSLSSEPTWSTCGVLSQPEYTHTPHHTHTPIYQRKREERKAGGDEGKKVWNSQYINKTTNQCSALKWAGAQGWHFESINVLVFYCLHLTHLVRSSCAAP